MTTIEFACIARGSYIPDWYHNLIGSYLDRCAWRPRCAQPACVRAARIGQD